MIEPNPVRGVHLLLNVPGDDEVLAPVQRVLQSGRRERRPALGGHQVGVAVGSRQSIWSADNRNGIDGCPAPLCQSPQVLRTEGVPQVGAASTRS